MQPVYDGHLVQLCWRAGTARVRAPSQPASQSQQASLLKAQVRVWESHYSSMPLTRSEARAVLSEIRRPSGRLSAVSPASRSASGVSPRSPSKCAGTSLDCRPCAPAHLHAERGHAGARTRGQGPCGGILSGDS